MTATFDLNWSSEAKCRRLHWRYFDSDVWGIEENAVVLSCVYIYTYIDIYIDSWTWLWVARALVPMKLLETNSETSRVHSASRWTSASFGRAGMLWSDMVFNKDGLP